MKSRHRAEIGTPLPRPSREDSSQNSSRNSCINPLWYTPRDHSKPNSRTYHLGTHLSIPGLTRPVFLRSQFISVDQCRSVPSVPSVNFDQFQRNLASRSVPEGFEFLWRISKRKPRRKQNIKKFQCRSVSASINFRELWIFVKNQQVLQASCVASGT